MMLRKVLASSLAAPGAIPEIPIFSSLCLLGISIASSFLRHENGASPCLGSLVQRIS